MRTFRMCISWSKGEGGLGEQVVYWWVGRMNRRLLDGARPALGSLLGLAPGAPDPRESRSPVPYQPVCVHLWGASEAGQPSLGPQPTSLQLCCPVVLTANQVAAKPQG